MASLLITPNTVRAPLHDRLGIGLLLLTFVTILSGRFTLDRINPSLPAVDLRLSFLYILAIGVLLWLSGAKEHLPQPVPVRGTVPFLAWAGWLGMSALWAPEGARIGGAALDLGLLVSFTLIAWVLMRRLPREATHRIWKWLLVAGVIYFAAAIATGPGAQGRYAAPGGGPNVFVRVMVLASIAALFFASEKRKTWPLFAIPVFATGAALSGSRGGLLSAAIMLIIFAAPIAKRLGAKRVIAILLAAAAGGAVFLTQNKGQFVEFVKARYFQQTVVEGYSSGRDTITEDALRLYGDSPVIGVGLDGYWALQASPEKFEYPHNLFIATMTEVGTVGLCLLVFALLTFLAATMRSRPWPPAVLYAVGAGCYLCASSVFSGDYYDTRLMWFFFGLAVIEAARPKKDVLDGSPGSVNPRGTRVPDRLPQRGVKPLRTGSHTNSRTGTSS